MKKTALLLALAGALSTSALAQEPKPAGEARPMPTPEERAKQMKERLGLNDEQAAKIKEVFEKYQPKFKEIRENTSLSQDEHRAKFRETLQATQLEIAPILTPEQKAKWKEEFEKRKTEGAKKE